MKYRVCYVIRDISHRGDWFDDVGPARAWVDDMNKKHPDIRHWLETSSSD